MIQLGVSCSIDKAVAKLNMTRVEAKKAITRALNSTIASAKVQASREVAAAGYGIKVSRIKQAISITKARGDVLRATMRATGRPIPLINYQARQTRKGVTVNVLNGRKLIPGAFIATMASGHRGVFVRKQGLEMGKRGRMIQNQHIGHELFGPSIPEAIGKNAVESALIAGMKNTFPVRFDQELNYLRIQGKK